MVFIGELQAQCYERFAAAMRKAGYAGLLTSSNWQAGRAYSHYTNLAGDAALDLIDRHNYFGGGKGGGNRIPQASMLKSPGMGMLSSGMQQVAGHPFMLSEWIHVTPNEWGAEGVAIIGAYGMGLQDWDVSFIFQNGDEGVFKAPINTQGWEAAAPQIMGTFPAFARMVRRGDVAPATVTAVRNVHLPSLGQGKLSFDDQVEQGYDDKTFGSDKVQAAALAVARCTVAFTKDWQETQPFDLKPYAKDGWLVSSTGQLRWKAGTQTASGAIAIDTPATQGVAGFLEGQEVRLGDAAITSGSRFAVICLTAQEQTATLKTAKKALLVAMARARNSDMKVFNGDTILAKGKAPTVLEPVRASLRLSRPGARIELLDHAGAATGRTLPSDGGAIAIDTARDQTPYYLISWP
jgi:hypothetical protein